jgi:hypothetical protein
MGTVIKIWLGVTQARIAREERGEVVTWVVLAIGIVVITTGVLAIVGAVSSRHLEAGGFEVG